MGYLRKYVIFAISFALIMSMLSLVESKEQEIQNNHFRITDVKSIDIIEFITISNDQNFTDYGFSGIGTAENPYIIENYTIEAYDYHNGIAVRDTTKHFVIRNCTVRAFWSGIFLVNVTNNTATIINNTCFVYPPALGSIGIGILNTNGAIITNNYCTRGQSNINFEEGTWGIFIQNANYSIVENNICEKQDMDGINSIFNENSIITGNNCSFNRGGIMLYDTIDNTVINNSLEWNDGGASIARSNVQVVNNSISFNERSGINIHKSKDAVLTDNVIEFNGGYGITAIDSDRCEITYNLIRNNTGYGVFLDLESRYNTVHHNYFIHNHIEGTSQAYDSGNNNTWFDVQTNEGNYWSSLGQNSTYHINGKAENNDLYPLNENLERITKTNLHFPSLFLFIFVISLNKLRRKSKKK